MCAHMCVLTYVCAYICALIYVCTARFVKVAGDLSKSTRICNHPSSAAEQKQAQTEAIQGKNALIINFGTLGGIFDPTGRH